MWTPNPVRIKFKEKKQKTKNKTKQKIMIPCTKRISHYLILIIFIWYLTGSELQSHTCKKRP